MEIQFDAYFIDSWDGESYFLEVDNVVRYTKVYTNGQISTIQYCGGSWGDWFTTVTIGAFSHSATSLQLNFYSTLNQSSSDESWGFKNVKITVWPYCNSACATCFGNLISECYSCNNGWYLKGSTCVTDCGANYWNNPTGKVCSSNFALVSCTLIVI